MFGKKKNECTPQCFGTNLLIIGVLIVLNARYSWFDWGTFVGGIIAIKGIIMLAMKGCPMCKN